MDESIKTMRIDGIEHVRIPFGRETYVDDEDVAFGCHDCEARQGQLHDPGCDVEQCPVCRLQALCCDCAHDSDDPWLGDRDPINIHDAMTDDLVNRLIESGMDLSPWQEPAPEEDGDADQTPPEKGQS